MAAERRVSPAALAIANALLAFLIFALFALQLRLLWDTDSYLHPAIARHYRLHGIFDPPPWGRFSMTSFGGDKDLLFHIALIPFTAGDPATGARIALAALNALLIGALTFVFGRGETWWAVALPWWLYVTANPFFTRVIRLRPDIVSLILLLFLCEAAARRRWALCGVLAAAYTLSYTPFHLMLGLAAVWFIADRVESGHWHWRMPAAMVGGVLFGLFVRPHPIENLRLWYAQNVTFYSLVGKLDIGQEVVPPRLMAVLPLIAGWLIGMIALVIATKRRRDADQTIDASQWEWIVYALALAVFLVLYARMNKMSIYAYPLAVATLLRWRAAQGRRIARWAAVAVIGSAIVALPALAHPTLMGILGLRGNVVTEADLEAFGKAVPAGARVAATWSDAELYIFWAPQARYLNIYDATFMYVPFPKLWEAQAALFAGEDPDVVATTRGPLQSDYLAFDPTGMPPRFLERVRRDPRLRVVYGGYNVLLAYQPAGEKAFITEWNGANGGAFVEPHSDAGCVTVRHTEHLEHPQRFEFVPWGPASLRVDGAPRVDIRRPLFAVLGHGAVLDLPLGEHVIEVTTCRAGARNGFYLVRR